MTALGSWVASAEGALGRPTTDGPAAAGVRAVLWGQNEDTRLLLRGLLRLHRCSVLHEVATLADLVALPSVPEPSVLVVDAESEAQGWERDLPTALKAHPELRGLVILPPAGGSLESRARAAGAVTVVVRPFAIRDFVLAVSAAAQSKLATPARSGP